MKRKIIVLTVVFIFLLAGCDRLPVQTTEETPLPPTSTPLPPTPTATETPVPPTATITPTITPTFTASPYPTGTMSAVISVASLNLRSGPGTVHEITAAYPEETSLTVLGAAPGYEWVQVQFEDGKIGWMTASFLTLEKDIKALPILSDLNSQMVSGKVINSNSEPIPDIQVSVYQRLLDTTTLSTDATTDENGIFYAYLPQSSTGNWEVSITAIGCESSIVNDRCNLQGYFTYNSYAMISLPQTSPLLFMYEEASAEIHGFVKDENGDAVSIRVFADRSDGAYAYTVSSTSGEFFIPASEGTWRVYAVVYNPYQEGESITIEVKGGETSQDINIVAPKPESE